MRASRTSGPEMRCSSRFCWAAVATTLKAASACSCPLIVPMKSSSDFEVSSPASMIRRTWMRSCDTNSLYCETAAAARIS